jgi:hypothetical protein
MVLVKSEQEIGDLVAGLLGFSPCSEAIAELPRFLVEICTLPLKTFNRTITQYDKVWIAVLRHPSLVC